MKRVVLTVLVLGCVVLTGCAQHYTEYAQAVKERDTAVAAAASSQQATSYAAWTKAIATLGASSSPNAQAALMALALQKPAATPVHSQPIAAPASGADYVRAAVPLAGVVAGAWVGGKVIDALANTAGVVNNVTAGGDANVKSTTVEQHKVGGDASTATCQDCGKEEAGEEAEKGTPPPTCGGGATKAKGTWWYDAARGCSCESHALGHC